MNKIFISYSRKDSEKAKLLFDFLIENGYEDQVWLDSISINPGELWDDAIIKALSRADIIISLITTDYVKSSYALSEFKYITNLKEKKQMLIIPVLFEEVEIPNFLKAIQYINAINKDFTEILPQLLSIIKIFEIQQAQEKQGLEEQKESIVDYVGPTLEYLEEREKKLRVIANYWNIAGYSALIIGVLGTISLIIIDNIYFQKIDWQRTIYLAIKGAIILILLLALSKYSFTLAKSYMNESLKIADRIHAIKFGKFYLDFYNNKISSENFKEIFQHWNLSKDSSFSAISADNFDPKLNELAIKIIESVKEVLTKSK